MSLYRADLPSLVVVSATGTTSTSNILSGMFDDAVGITICAPASLSHVFHLQVSQDLAAATSSTGWATAMSGGSVVAISAAGQTVTYLTGSVAAIRLSSMGVEATTNGSTTRTFTIAKQFQVG